MAYLPEITETTLHYRIVEAKVGGLHKNEYELFFKKGEEPDLGAAFPRSSRMGAGWNCQLDKNVSINFWFTDEAEEWLKAQDNQGTLLTARGEINYSSDDANNNHTAIPTLMETKDTLEDLCLLLSFPNGGYIGPAVIQAREWEAPFTEAKLFGAYQVTPVELLGHTWLIFQSDLCQYISCLPEFQRMIKVEPWNRLFGIALVWYYQAIQPSFAQLRGKSWPIVANALGALLERLTYEVVRELDTKPRGKPQERVKFVLETLGITKSKYVYYDDEDFIELFFKVRNDATHPTEKGGYTEDQLQLSLQYATQWVEEIILWRLGYTGAYRNRLRNDGYYVFETPRYTLESRKTTWL